MENENVNDKYANATDEDIALAKMSGAIPQDYVRPEKVETKEVVEEKKPNPLEQIEETKETTEVVETEDEEIEVDFDKVTKGKIKSKKELEDALTELETHRVNSTKYKELEKEIEKYRSTNSLGVEIDDPDFLESYKNLQIGKKVGTKDSSLINKIADIDNLSDIETIKLQELIDDPELKDDLRLLERELAKKYKTDKYKINPDYDDLSDEEKEEIDLEVKANLRQLKKDASQVRTKIKEKIADIKLPIKKSAEEAEKELMDKRKETITKWQKPFKEMAESTKEIGIKAMIGNKEVEIAIPLTEAQSKEIEQVQTEIATLIVNQNLDLTDETEKAIKQGYNDRLQIVLNKYIYGYIISQAEENKDGEWRKKTHNPSAKAKNASVKIETQTQTDEDKALEAMKKERF